MAWGAGNGKTLGVRVTSAGQTTTYTYTYTVFKGVCVNGAAGVGQDTNAGTVLAPVASVQKGIDLVQSLYTTGEVHVAQRSTNPTLNQYSASNIVAAMVEGISLYGGYSLDFSVRNPAAYETVLVDSSTNGGTTPFGTMSATNQPNRAVYFPPGITSATVIDGFTVMPGSGNSNAAVSVCGGSPTIQNLKITGAANPISGTGKYVIGIYVFDPNGAAHAASPVIKNCVIDPGWTTAESDTTGNAIGVGLDNCAAPQVKSSTISGGHGYVTKAFSCRSDTAFLTTTTTIQGNSIDCGAAASVATGLHYCIFFGPTIGVSITSNSFHNAGAADTHYAIYESRTQGSVAHSPASVSSNTFSLSGFASGGTGGYYFDNNATAILDLTSNITLNTGTAVTDDTTTTLTAGGNIQN